MNVFRGVTNVAVMSVELDRVRGADAEDDFEGVGGGVMVDVTLSVSGMESVGIGGRVTEVYDAVTDRSERDIEGHVV